MHHGRTDTTPDPTAAAAADLAQRLATRARHALAIFETPDDHAATVAAAMNGERQRVCERLNLDVADHDRIAVRLALASMAERGDLGAIKQVMQDIGALPGVDAEIQEGTSDA